MSPQPVVLVAPHFRRMDEIFDMATLDRLHRMAEVRWGRDGPVPSAEFAAMAEEADAIVFGTWQYPTESVRSAARLRLVLEVAGGHHHPDFDYASCFAREIPVGSCAPAFGPVVAEMALTLALDACRGVATADRRFRAGTEEWLHAGNRDATSLLGATVGFVGCGGLSRSLQTLLAPFGVSQLGTDPWVPDAVLRGRGIEPVTLDALFDRSDVVFVLAVPTPSNRGLIDRDLMQRLGPRDVLVVASRSHLVDFEALTELLHARRFKAGIDVFPEEPMPADHPIRSAPGAVLTAHLAGALPEALLEIGRMVVDDLTDCFAGRLPSRMQYATPAIVSGLRDPGGGGAPRAEL